jgi:acetyltransferase-like isoleucine patch superfamily enzyme
MSIAKRPVMVAEHLWTCWARLALLAHTVLVCGRFSSWGRKSRIAHSAKLVAPYLVQVGDRVHICEHAWLNACDDRSDGAPTLHIGDGAYIGRFAHINAWRAVHIGRDVLIADRVFISDCAHNFANIALPIAHQGDAFGGAVTLMDGCWIGIGAVILPGVTVGRNAVVAANAVVTCDVADFTVVAGMPARCIRTLAPVSSGR